MDATACRDFFTQPSQTFHRQYEALRAIFVDQGTQKEVAREFGYTYGSMRQLIFGFRRLVAAERESSESPFFVIRPVAEWLTTMSRPIPSLLIDGS